MRPDCRRFTDANDITGEQCNHEGYVHATGFDMIKKACKEGFKVYDADGDPVTNPTLDNVANAGHVRYTIDGSTGYEDQVHNFLIDEEAIVPDPEPVTDEEIAEVFGL